ncbi:uncharacterized protein J3R85_006458 [Psidium guajava]|nr:uncharacterized protein J3R85_006458 [Psidium guajava]
MKEKPLQGTAAAATPNPEVGSSNGVQRKATEAAKERPQQQKLPRSEANQMGRGNSNRSILTAARRKCAELKACIWRQQHRAEGEETP